MQRKYSSVPQRLSWGRSQRTSGESLRLQPFTRTAGEQVFPPMVVSFQKLTVIANEDLCSNGLKKYLHASAIECKCDILKNNDIS